MIILVLRIMHVPERS